MHTAASTQEEKSGLLYWAVRALHECEKASVDFAADPVHDLRVAIRRCRSMADGFISVDPDPRWKQMKRHAKPLFASLGFLRDTQVMMEWVEKLSDSADPIRLILLETLRKQEGDQKQAALQALQAFDRERWLELNTQLAERSREVPLEGKVFQFVALERLHDAGLLHRQAMRNRTANAYHQLRIGIKRFRYTVENFLPERHVRWSKDLRRLQDALGEVHDFDVLWAAIRTHTEVPAAERTLWRDILNTERAKRLDAYREKMIGADSLWRTWESELPGGNDLLDASLEKFRTWAHFLDPQQKRTDDIERISLTIFDGLVAAGKLGFTSRRALEAAAILHDIGRSKQKPGPEKRSYRMIRRIAPPLGWTDIDMVEVAAIARYHRGKLPSLDDVAFENVPAIRVNELLVLAGILRLANAIEDCVSTDPQIRATCVDGFLKIQLHSAQAIISGEGERLARAKYLLEASCRVTVLIETAGENSTIVDG